VGERDLACVIVVPAPAGVPQLRRQAASKVTQLPAGGGVHCAADGTPSPTATCEVVDDLDALEGKVQVCGPGGPESPDVCPTLKKRRIVREDVPLTTQRPCGDSAAPNLQIRLEDGSGHVLHRVVFYDDPSCHKPALTPPSCTRQPRAVYYRVLSVVSYFRDGGE